MIIIVIVKSKYNNKENDDVKSNFIALLNHG